MIKTKKSLLILLVAASISSTITVASYMYYESLSVYYVNEMGMDVYVGKNPGINVDTDAVHFGKVPPGSTGSRKMTVTAGEFPTIVSFEHYGEISEWTSITENNFMLNPGENKTIFVQVSVPDDIVPLVYRNGTLKIVMRKLLI